MAHQVQAARDLKASPLFIDGQTSLGITYMQHKGEARGPITYQVPDPRVRDSVIIPFRRMWMNDEPANFDRVGNIIKRYWPEARPYVDVFKDGMKKAKANYPPACYIGLIGDSNFTISPKDVIDLWLNCRLAHVGGRPGKGRFTRVDFDKNVETYGAEKLEYMYVTAVHQVGPWFISLAQLSERLLENWSKGGIEPSFFFDNITDNGRVPSGSRDSLKRYTPGITIDDSDEEMRLEVLFRRQKYSQISKLIYKLEASKSDTLRFVRISKNAEEMFAHFGIAVESVKTLDEFDRPAYFSTISDGFDMNKLPWRKGMVALLRDKKTLFAQGDALTILTEQLLELNSEISSDELKF